MTLCDMSPQVHQLHETAERAERSHALQCEQNAREAEHDQARLAAAAQAAERREDELVELHKELQHTAATHCNTLQQHTAAHCTQLEELHTELARTRDKVLALAAADARAKEVRALNDKLLCALELMEQRCNALGCGVGSAPTPTSRSARLGSSSVSVMALVAEKHAERQVQEASGMTLLRGELQKKDAALSRQARQHEEECTEREAEFVRLGHLARAQRERETHAHYLCDLERERERARAQKQSETLEVDNARLVRENERLQFARASLEKVVEVLQTATAVVVALSPLSLPCPVSKIIGLFCKRDL